MKEKIFGIALRIIAVILAFSLLTLLFMPKYIEKNTDGRIMPEFYREKTAIDVDFIGSSTVQAGISPMTLYREYGITSYDRSNSSQVMALSYYVAEDTIKRNKPKLIVLDVGFIYQSFDFVDEGASRKSLDGMRWSKSKSEAIKAMMDDTEHYIDYVFPILRFHSRWNDLSLEDIKYLVYKPTVTNNGQLLKFESRGSEYDYNPYMLESSILACSENMEYLQCLTYLCKENDVELLLIKMPLVSGNWSREIDNQISSFAAENGIIYKNFIDDFDAIGLVQETDFSDSQHMNVYGAEKFTKVLGKYIIENYGIRDRRDDPNIEKAFKEKLDRYEYAIEHQIPTEMSDDSK